MIRLFEHLNFNDFFPGAARDEPLGIETCRRDLSTSSSRIAQVESLEAEMLIRVVTGSTDRKM
jgi:hypothetical protein